MNLLKKNSQGVVLGFLVIIAVFGVLLAFLEVRKDSNQETYRYAAQKKINAQDTESVKNRTISFFSTFKTGVPMNEKVLTDVTYQYFDKDFLQNTFPKEKSKLFGIYGYGKLIHSYTNADGLQAEGGIKGFEIMDIQKDNVNKVITVYTRMDALEPNTVHWIEWRDVPGEGWKINSISFDGNIKELSPLSPKKEEK